MKIRPVALFALIGFLVIGSMGSIQARSDELTQVQAAPVTVKLTVNISRMNGTKQLSNLPFQLLLIPNMRSDKDTDGESVSIQNGSEVPVPQTTFQQTSNAPIMSYSYRSVGTNIRASARGVDGVFSVSLMVTDSQVLSDLPESGLGGMKLPRFQSFTNSGRLLLRDGQTVQYVAATDKVSGDVVKLDVTLNVVK